MPLIIKTVRLLLKRLHPTNQEYEYYVQYANRTSRGLSDEEPELPGGKVESNESVKEAIIKEITEEVSFLGFPFDMKKFGYSNKLICLTKEPELIQLKDFQSQLLIDKYITKTLFSLEIDYHSSLSIKPLGLVEDSLSGKFAWVNRDTLLQYSKNSSFIGLNTIHF